MKLKFDVTSEELSELLNKQYRMLSGRLNNAVDRKDYTQAKTLLERVSEMDDLLKHKLLPNSIANVVISVDVVVTPTPPYPTTGRAPSDDSKSDLRTLRV